MDPDPLGWRFLLGLYRRLTSPPGSSKGEDLVSVLNQLPPECSSVPSRSLWHEMTRQGLSSGH